MGCEWHEEAINRVISSGDLYCYLLPHCDALHSGSLVATLYN